MESLYFFSYFTWIPFKDKNTHQLGESQRHRRKKVSVMKRFVKKLLFKEGNEKQVISVVVEIDVHLKYLSAKQKFPGLTCKKNRKLLFDLKTGSLQHWSENIHL